MNIIIKIQQLIVVYIFDEFKGLSSTINSDETKVRLIKTKFKKSKEEIKRAGEFEYIITNDDVDRAARDILAIITAEKLKASKNINTAKELE